MSVDNLVAKAQDLKQKGLATRDICQELHLSKPTVEWLLAKLVEPENTTRIPADVKIGWRTIGISGVRTRAVAEVMADVVLEEQEKHQFTVNTVASTLNNGVSLGSFVSELLELDLSIIHPAHEDSTTRFASNFAGLADKSVVIIDDVVSSGNTAREVIDFIRAQGGKPVLVMALVNKLPDNELDGVPLRALVRARPVSG